MLTRESIDYLVNHAKDATWSANAFNCRKCPKEGCPAWWNITWSMFNKETLVHTEKNIVGCGFSLMPILLADVITSSYRNIDVTQESINRTDKSHTLMKQGLVAIGNLMMNKSLEEKKVNSIESGEEKCQ